VEIIDYTATRNRNFTPFSCSIQNELIASGVSNLTNTIVGAGMLGLPFALHSAGLVAGSILFFIAPMATIFGLHLLSVAAEHVKQGDPSYFSVATITFPKAAILIDAAVAIKCFGVALSYLIVIGSLVPDIMHNILPNASPDNILFDRRFWIPMAAIVCVPISLLKTLHALRFVSYIALGSVLYIVILMLYFFLSLEVEISPQSIQYLPLDFGVFFKTLPTFVFAFTCHQNIFLIQNEMQGNIPGLNKVIIISVLIALFVYTILGYSGVFSFGRMVKDNIINNLPRDAIEVTICRVAVTTLIAFSYPLQIQPCRKSLTNLISNFFPKARDSTLFFYSLTLTLCLITFVTAFFVSDLGIVFGIVGATGSVTICYILPGAFYVKIKENEPWHFKKIMAAVLSVVGVGLMVNSLTWIVYNEVTK